MDPASTPPPSLYHELADWYPLLTAPEDYVEEAGLYLALLEAVLGHIPTSILELGAGGGHNAWHYRQRILHVVLCDASPEMLALSRGLNPDCEHVLGDMRSLRLERQFEVVFIHDAIGYLTSAADVRDALQTAFVHCQPGGVVLITPDAVRESFRADTDHGGHDAADGRALRYLEWTYDPDPTDSTYMIDYVCVLHAPGAEPRVVMDRHVQGLFSTHDWLTWLADVGFRPELRKLRHSEEPQPLHAFVGLRD